MSGTERFSFSRFGDTRKIVSIHCVYYYTYYKKLCVSQAYSDVFGCALIRTFLQTSDTVGYDEYVEGVEPDETTSLETPIKEV